MKAPVAKQYISEALFRLMAKMDYRSISVSRLVSVAGVSRSTFYRNYYDMLDIVDEFYKDTISEIYSKYPLTESTMSSVIKNIFSELKSKRNEFEILNRQGLLDRMSPHVYNTSLKQINNMGVWHNRYQPHFFAGASFALIKAWIEYGFEETEEEITNIFLKSLEGYMFS